MNSGKIIVIEGADGSGKTTQLTEVLKRFANDPRNFRSMEFPNYESESSFGIREYLNGDITCNCMQASTLYAIDRFITFKKVYQDLYTSGTPLITGRWITSNVAYQSSRIISKIIQDEGEDGFSKIGYQLYALLSLINMLEFRIYELPPADLTIYLRTPKKRIDERVRMRTRDLDVHETDTILQKQVRDFYENPDEYFNIANGISSVKIASWESFAGKYVIIDVCDSEGNFLPKDHITDMICDKIDRFMKGEEL